MSCVMLRFVSSASSARPDGAVKSFSGYEPNSVLAAGAG